MLPLLYPDCPRDRRCGPWRSGIDVRVCTRCGREVPADGVDGDALPRDGAAEGRPAPSDAASAASAGGRPAFS